MQEVDLTFLRFTRDANAEEIILSSKKARVTKNEQSSCDLPQHQTTVGILDDRANEIPYHGAKGATLRPNREIEARIAQSRRLSWSSSIFHIKSEVGVIQSRSLIL